MKNKMVFKLIALILFLTTGVYAQNFWQQLPGPYGGTIIKVISSPGGALYAISETAVFKSTNEGSHWIQVTPPSINNLKTGGVAPNGYIYVATGNFTSKIYRSSNEGLTWEERLPDGGYEFNDMTVTPGGNILAGTFYMFSFHGNFIQSGDIYRSTNNGNSFSLVNFPDLAVRSIKSNTNGDIYVATLNGLFKSIDGGASWGLARPDTCSRVFTAANGFVFVQTGQSVLRSTDNGGSWINTGSRMPVASGSGDFLYAAEGGKIFRSADFGSSWTEIAVISNAPFFDIYSIIFTGSNNLYAGTDLGVYKSVNGGFAWTDINSGIRLADITTISANGNSIFAGSLRYISRSTDNGISWSNLTGGLPESGAKKLKIIQNNLVIAFIYLNGIYRSINNGDTWNKITSLPPDANTGIITVSNNSNIFIAGNDSIYRSTDNGESWIIINNGLPADNPVITGISADNENNLYASVKYGPANLFTGLFKSTNNGALWNQINSQNVKADFKYTSNGDIYCITANRLMHSTNSGVSFSIVPSAPNYCIELEISNHNDIFLHFVDNEIYGIKRSADNAVTWSEFTLGLGQLLVYDFELDNNSFLYAATQSGLFKTINSTLGITNKNTETPSGFMLSQNYPNPFNPETKIIFSLPKKEFTRLALYNSIGEEVAILVNSELNPGTYEFSWNASGFASGIYFYKFETGSFKSVKKMVLLK